jgi:hypothetical protein
MEGQDGNEAPTIWLVCKLVILVKGRKSLTSSETQTLMALDSAEFHQAVCWHLIWRSTVYPREIHLLGLCRFMTS